MQKMSAIQVQIARKFEKWDFFKFDRNGDLFNFRPPIIEVNLKLMEGNSVFLANLFKSSISYLNKLNKLSLEVAFKIKRIRTGVSWI